MINDLYISYLSMMMKFVIEMLSTYGGDWITKIRSQMDNRYCNSGEGIKYTFNVMNEGGI